MSHMVGPPVTQAVELLGRGRQIPPLAAGQRLTNWSVFYHWHGVATSLLHMSYGAHEENLSLADETGNRHPTNPTNLCLAKRLPTSVDP